MSQRSIRRTSGPLSQAGSRLGMSHKDVTERTPQLTQAAQKLRDGTLTREEYDALVNTYKPVEPFANAPIPTSREDALDALSEPKRVRYGATADIPAGERTELRLDIPAYTGSGAWVNSVHRPQSKQPTVYSSTSSARNVGMIVPESKALDVAAGGAKSPFAVMRGKWNPMSDDEALARMMQALEEPSRWRQIGMDPERHSYFYDRATMQPVTRAEEVVQVGPLVVGRDVTYGSKADFKYASGGAVEGYQRGGRARTSGPLSQTASKADVGSAPQADTNGLMQDLYRGYNEDLFGRLEGDRKSAEQKLLDTFGKDTLFGRWKPSTIDEVLFELDRMHPGILKLREEAIDKTLATGNEHGFFTKGDLDSGAPRKMKIESGDAGSMPESFVNRLKRGLLPTQSGFGLEMHTHPRGSAIESSGDFHVNTDLTRRDKPVSFFSLVDSAGQQGRSASLTLNDNNMIPTNRRDETFGKIFNAMRAKDRDVMDMIYLEPEYRKTVMRGDKIGERERDGIIRGVLSPTATSRTLARNNMGLHMFEDYGGVPMWSGERWINTSDLIPVPRTIPGSVPQALRNIDRFIVDELGYADGGAVEDDDAALQRMMRELQDENALMRAQELPPEQEAAPEAEGIRIDLNSAPEGFVAQLYDALGIDGYQRGGRARPGGQLSRQEAKKVAESLERASTEKDIRNVPLPSDINEVFDAMDYSIPGTKNAWSRAAQDTIRKNIEHGFFSAPDPVALSVASDPRNVSVFASNVLSGEPHSIDLSTPRPTLGTMLSHPAARHVDPYHAAGPHGFGMTMHTHPNSLAIPSGPDFDLSGWVGRDILQHANIHGIEGTHPDSSSRSLIFTRPDLAKSGPRFGLKQQINWDLVNDPDFFHRAQFTDPALENRDYQITLSQTLAPILTERLLDRVGRGKVWTQFDPNATFWNVDGKPLTRPGATDEILKSFDDVVRQRWGYADGGPVNPRLGALTQIIKRLMSSGDERAARRLERAADEVPNLTDQFSADALERAASRDARFSTVNPAEFERYAYPLEGPIHKLEAQELFDATGGKPRYRDVPWISLDRRLRADGEDRVLPVPGVRGHEGRHRMRALAGGGNERSLMMLMPEYEGMKHEFGPSAFYRKGDGAIDEYLSRYPRILPQDKRAMFGMSRAADEVDLPLLSVPMPEYYAEGGTVDPDGINSKPMASGGAVSNDMLTYGMRPQAMSDGWRASSPAMEYSWPTPQQADPIAAGLSSFTPGSASAPGDAGQARVDTPNVSTPGMNAGRALGVMGQLGSMFTGIPGLGLAGTALGTALEAREYDAALDAARAANPGYAFPGLTASQVMSGIANNLSFGMFGTSLNDSFVDNAIAGTSQSRGGASGPGTGDPEADAAAAAAAAAAGLGNAAENAVDTGQIS